ncbi:OsmC family protein [Fusibacter sp. JL216-2]|uniref:OsmC family protein n=1 Tax=Fusibacter sp. JL216-2 TaxID=3071453 RepID=UPI003D327070
MSHTIKTSWIDGMAFETDISGHKLTVDAAETFGGQNRGPLPKPLLLNALSGCTAMDVMSILGKMQVEIDAFDIEVEGQLADEHPKVYTKVHVIYSFKGDNLPLKKLEKAVKLSQEKYCGVIAMVKQAAEVTYEIKVIE